ncbi:putative phage tail protein [Helicovermis profundi]|uniref:DUF2313 domain-containing protein n=1 Tax=Helicovermis profundi TaxID=3065157 RepID=A0AAU9E382_9FIRM|nr:hypothetical protein HLPR_11540 [Clostridia bacterium S502]
MTNYKEKLINHLSKILREDEIANSLFDSISKELMNIDKKINLSFCEFFVDTAIGSGLTSFEKRLGIETNILSSVDQRRNLIKARLRGRKKISLSIINSICEVWINGEASSDISENIISINLRSFGGVSDDFENLEKTILKLIPCSLAVKILNEITVNSDKEKTFLGSIVTQGYHYTLTPNINITYSSNETIINGSVSIIGSKIEIS